MNLFDWLATLWDVASLRIVDQAELGLPSLQTAGLIALIAGFSTLLGHCAILFINRVKGVRFLAALAVGAVFLLLLYGFQAMILWAVNGPITQQAASFHDIVTVTLASTAPLAFGFLVFIPYLGILIGRILQVWSVLCLWLLVMALQDTTWWQALLATASAWLLMQLASRLLGRPVGAISARVWSFVTGRPARLESPDVLAGVPFVPVEGAAR